MSGRPQIPEISFVIPALNEADNIPRTLASIREQAAGYSHEVILVDNGSTDATVRLAQEGGATVLVDPTGTIAALRNLGAGHARGRTLVFLDADASLTPQWRANLPAALAAVAGPTPVITGSHCSPPDDGSWIERNWFQEFALERDVSHLGTGHMLLAREFFLRVGGFDESLETGEDYEFCQRAKTLGAVIVNDPQLRVIHHDFPTSLARFVRRESWHGRGDLRSLRTLLSSKVAVGAAVFAVAHLLLLVGVLTASAAVSALGAALLVSLLLASTWKKYRHAPWRSQLINAGLFYFYYLGRALSFLHLLQRKPLGAQRTA